MKTTKLITIIVATLLLLISCKKDENGYYITYYKNKTCIGYVFYKYDNDSIAPIANVKMSIKSYTGGGELFNSSHFDYTHTDNNGKYTFDFVKKINGVKVVGYNIECLGSLINSPTIFPTSGSIRVNNETIGNIFYIDTIFFYPK